jgi:hypothetical protein
MKEQKKIKINKKHHFANRQGGAAMLVSIVFYLFISLAIISGLVSPPIREFKDANMNLNSKRSFFLAESGIEDAVYRTLKNMTISENEIITIDSNSTTTTITTLLGNVKQIVSLADISNFQRKIDLTLKTGDGIVFKYGTQSGQGGFIFQNNSFVDGSLYSNGNIIGSNGAYITGDAFVAGATGLISNMRIGYGGTGNAHSHNVTNSTVTGNIYCQTGSGNNKSCDTSEDDPVTENLPISDDDITKWKADATEGGVINNSVVISTPTTMGPKKIVGNLTIDSTLTVANTLYVTGNVVINVGKKIELDSSYGATSGIIMSDGYIVINNNVIFQNSGTVGSYILFLSNSTCDASISDSPCNGHNAIEVSNNSDISIVNAQKGTVFFNNNARVKEAVGNIIELKQNVGISYGSGLINVDFTSGPSGSWGIEGWREK